FHFEIVAVVMVKLLERFDQKIIDWKPDWSAPVRVATENPGLRFGRFVTDDLFFATHSDRVRVRLMKFTERTNSVIAQKFFGVEHASEQTFHAMPASERDQAQFFHARLLPARN